MTTSDDVVEQLLASMPSIAPAWAEHLEFWGEDTPGSYNDVSVIATHVTRLFAEGQVREVDAMSLVVERLLDQPVTEEVLTLLAFGLIEDTQNHLCHGRLDDVSFRARLGRRTQQLWDEVHAYWYEAPAPNAWRWLRPPPPRRGA